MIQSNKQIYWEISVQTHGISLVHSSRPSERLHWSIWIDVLLLLCRVCVAWLFPVSPLLFQCSDDTGIGTACFSSQKSPHSTKATLQNWHRAFQYIEPFLSAKDIFVVFTKRKMTFDTEVHNEFKRTKKLLFLEELCFSWAVETPSEPPCN